MSTGQATQRTVSKDSLSISRRISYHAALGGAGVKNIAFLWAILAVSVGLAQDKPSVVGTWKLDIAQSDFGSDPAPRSIAAKILTDTPQMLSYREDGVDDKGQPFVYSWKGPEDGSMHPALWNGKPSGQSGAKKEQDGTLVQHGETAGGSTFEARMSVSPDGNTLTEENIFKSKDGKESRYKRVWHRVKLP
jgi:hypothetical protein